MGVPANAVSVAPQDRIVDGVLATLPLLIGVWAVLAILAIIDQAMPAKRPVTFLQDAQVSLLLASSFDFLYEAFSFDKSRIAVFSWTTPYTRPELVVDVVFVVLATLIGVLRRRRPSRTVLSGRWRAQVMILSIFFILTATTFAASIDGTRQASDELWRLVPYRTVTFVSGDSQLSTGPYMYVAQNDGGFFVHDLNDIGGKKAQAMFVPDGAVTNARVDTVTPS